MMVLFKAMILDKSTKGASVDGEEVQVCGEHQCLEVGEMKRKWQRTLRRDSLQHKKRKARRMCCSGSQKEGVVAAPDAAGELKEGLRATVGFGNMEIRGQPDRSFWVAVGAAGGAARRYGVRGALSGGVLCGGAETGPLLWDGSFISLGEKIAVLCAGRNDSVEGGFEDVRRGRLLPGG